MDKLINYYNNLDDFVVDHEFPLMHLAYPIVGLIVYLFIVYGLKQIIGDKKKGEKQTGFVYGIINFLSLIHNIIMFLFSLISSIGFIYETSKIITTKGFVSISCDIGRKSFKGKLLFWLYLYYLSKYYEFLDTLFIVLKKGRLRFIHTYHHVMTLVLCYCGLYFQGIGVWPVVLLNTMVHVPMYFYYAIYTIGIRDVWWKNYLTDIQLTQFVLDIIYGFFFIAYNHIVAIPKGTPCLGPDIIVAEYFLGGAISVAISYFILFYTLKQKNVKAMSKKKNQ